MATPSSTSPETMTSERNSNEDVEKLRSAAMNGDWYSVLDMYREKRELRMAKITKGDTVLHMAVSSGKESLVDDMVDIVCGERTNLQDETSTSLPPVDENGNEKKDVLGAKNDQGNTPLHLAASIGNVRMCKKIGGKDSSLIAERNNAGETPLFLAFFHRHKKAFLWLHYQFMGSPGVVSSTDIAHFIKRDNDDTILHCALEEEHIDVAIEIVLLYKEYLKEMTMMRNKNGLSPLHVLAVSHSAFESTHLPSLPFIGQLFYHFCNLEGTFFRVKKKKQATTKEELEQHERKPCVESIIDALVEYGSNRVDDLEGSCWAVTIGNIIVCSLCVLAVIPLIPPFLAEILIHGVRNLKEKHRWSLQIAEELLQHAPEEDMLANPYGEDGGDAGQ